MGELAKAMGEAPRSQERGADRPDIQALAEEEAEAELAAALKSGDAKRIRAAMRAVRELED